MPCVMPSRYVLGASIGPAALCKVRFPPSPVAPPTPECARTTRRKAHSVANFLPPPPPIPNTNDEHTAPELISGAVLCYFRRLYFREPLTEQHCPLTQKEGI
jgi:hypothetical protein